ncbi:hypothetical protein PMAYCL1PPCAC_27067, partial [Pristionchus mayeri]
MSFEFALLPDGVIGMIFSYLDYRSTLALRETSKSSTGAVEKFIQSCEIGLFALENEEGAASGVINVKFGLSELIFDIWRNWFNGALDKFGHNICLLDTSIDYADIPVSI